MGSNIAFGSRRVITPARAVQMAEIMPPEKIAERIGVDLEDVLAALAAAGQARKRVSAINHRTGQRISGFTVRGLYLKAQLRGWGALGEHWDFLAEAAA